VAIAATSEPASGSVSANAATRRPAANAGSCARWSAEPASPSACVPRLHGEDRVGARRDVPQHLARQAHRAGIDASALLAGARHHELEQPGPGQRRGRAAIAHRVVGPRARRLDRLDLGHHRAQPLGELAVAVVEEHREVVAR
jgi:hypothetical protein